MMNWIGIEEEKRIEIKTIKYIRKISKKVIK